MRPFMIAANWKMNKTPSEAREFFKQLLPSLKAGASLSSGRETKFIFFVPMIDLTVANELLAKTPFSFGAQNSHFELKGAFTGETSPLALAEIGCTFTLVGHSERRALFHETDLETGRKVHALQSVGITPVLCVGESLTEREADKTDEVIVRQLKVGLAHRIVGRPFVLAYEPVWAIGTGKVATPEQAERAHLTLRKAMSELVGNETAQITPILYGGSVNPINAGELKLRIEIDGFLVGGASLESESFLKLATLSI